MLTWLLSSGNHSSKFAPVIQPTLRVAAEALIVASLNTFVSS
jgi:hypothetical protein